MPGGRGRGSGHLHLELLPGALKREVGAVEAQGAGAGGGAGGAAGVGEAAPHGTGLGGTIPHGGGDGGTAVLGAVGYQAGIVHGGHVGIAAAPGDGAGSAVRLECDGEPHRIGVIVIHSEVFPAQSKAGGRLPVGNGGLRRGGILGRSGVLGESAVRGHRSCLLHTLRGGHGCGVLRQLVHLAPVHQGHDLGHHDPDGGGDNDQRHHRAHDAQRRPGFPPPSTGQPAAPSSLPGLLLVYIIQVLPGLTLLLLCLFIAERAAFICYRIILTAIRTADNG